MSVLARAKARRDGIDPDTVAPVTESSRICRLPVVHYQVDRHAVSRRLWRPDYVQPQGRTERERMDTLRDLQAEALEAIRLEKGLAGPIGVGWGKSLIALLAGTVLGVDLAIVLTPAQTLSTLRGTYFRARQIFRMAPRVCLDYSIEDLSQPRTTSLLAQMTKGTPASKIAIVVDEAHAFKAIKTSTRARRLWDFWLANPDIHVVVLSGTMLSTSIKDCAHLFQMALRERSPLPRMDDQHTLNAWAQVLDLKGKPGPTDWEAFRPLWNWYLGHHKPQNPLDDMPLLDDVFGAERVRWARRAFQYRLRTCPGVVASNETAIGTSLVVRGLDLPVPDVIQELTEKIVAEGRDPGGEVLVDDVSKWRAERQIAQGFHYRWAWEQTPSGKPDNDWLDARANWHRFVRAELQRNAEVGYDSPMLVYNRVGQDVRQALWDPVHLAWVEFATMNRRRLADEDLPEHAAYDKDDTEDVNDRLDAIREANERTRAHKQSLIDAWVATGRNFAEVGVEVCHALRVPIQVAWAAWTAQKDKDPPPTVPVWHDSYLMEHAVQWAREQKGPVILWYGDKAVEEALTFLGVPCYGAGAEPPSVAITCGMSIHAQGTGKNFQAWTRNLVLCPPTSGKVWEQMIGRTHRPGQDADQVEVYVYQHVDAFTDAMHQAIKGAIMLEDSLGNPQKLLLATYVDVPAALRGGMLAR